MTIDSTRFAEFFREVHRDENGNTFDPFPWQQRLADRVCSTAADAVWPDALALPTGSGKTTCIDIAVYALACQAHLPTHNRTAPRRILFVVDRRVIVDEAFEHAFALAKRLNEANSGILKDVADALRGIAGSDTPLTCHQLRGGMYRDDAWARTPSQPCVIASTVDQIGSRLLFRGYGRSFKSWPVHAGLAGNDALILLDEAHCANPFRQTMLAVQSYRGRSWAEQPSSNPFQCVILSATPPADCGSVESATDDDRSHPVLGRRVKASKPATLHVAARAKGMNAQRELAVELVQQAIARAAAHRSLRGDETDSSRADIAPPAVAVLVNRVHAARLVHELFSAVAHQLDPTDGRPSETFETRVVRRIAKQYGESLGHFGESFDCQLMIGRMRPIDRQDVTEFWLGRLSAGRAGTRQLDRPVFITATQCLEVGANLDFDVMVSECASLDALRQRFGRLNRIGRDIPAPAAIVIRKDQETAKDADPIYGNALTATWTQLNAWLSDGMRTDRTVAAETESGSPDDDRALAEPPTIDFGVAAMESRWNALDDEQRAKLIPPAPNAPVMLPAHIDAWVQTSPEPKPTPDVSIFLHGPQQGAPEVQVCWRADLRNVDQPSDVSAVDAIEAVSLCPPTSLECLSVPRHLFVRWWIAQCRPDRDRDKALREAAESLADVDSAGDDGTEEAKTHLTAVLWRGPKESRLLKRITDLRPGETIVLPAGAGGSDVFGYVPDASEQTIDAGDRCHWLARRKAVLRLTAKALDSPLWPETDGESKERLRQALKDFAEDPDLLPERDNVLDWLHDHAAEIDTSQRSFAWLRDAIEHGLPKRSRPELVPHPTGGIVIRGRWRWRPDTLTASDLFTTEDDTASTGGQVTLQQHCREVAERAEVFARRCDLSPSIVATLRTAGRLHDLGKADRRFQAYLFGGNRRIADLAGDLFAKSSGLRDNRRSYDSAWRDADLPDGFRHEILSLQLVQQFADKLELESSAGDEHPGDGHGPQTDSVDRDLLLHLIGMHHGHCRPFAPVVIDQPDELESLEVDLRPAGIAITVPGAERNEWPPLHRIDSGVAERFWRLVRRYGWWGLAWLEAIFVFADHRTSEAESDHAAQSPPRTTKQPEGAPV